MQKGIESLHSHTTYSDGKMSHQKVLEIAQQLGVGVVAFTDHDVLPEESLIKELKSINSPVQWLIGIEISAGLPKELGGGADGPHMIGLFVDPTNKALLDYCAKSQEERVNKMKRTVKNLQDAGFAITEEECMQFAQGKSIGRPHIVAALKAKEENIKLLNEYREKMRKAGETDPQIQAKYQLMMQQGQSQYPYALFLGDDAFIPDVLSHSQYWLDFDQSVELIRNAGGIASVAHYATVKQNLDFAKLEKLLKDNRVDGMETVYGMWKYGTNEEQDMVEERQKVRELVQKYNRLATGGADAHDQKDWETFAKETWYSNETVGMIETVISRIKPSLEFSNIK